MPSLCAGDIAAKITEALKLATFRLNATDPVAMSDKLPPFLFSKKPIESRSQPHLAILDILPKQPSLPFVVDDVKSPPTPSPPDLLEEVDFDRQIRAPRMTLPTHYTYKREQLASTTLKESFEPPDPPQKEYLPAALDLSQPTRRFSAPSDMDLPDTPSRIMLNYTANNSVYDGRAHQQHALIRALENLSSNLTSDERQPDKGAVQQLYKQKKPMIVPAVLRANDPSSSRSSPPSPYLQLKRYPFPDTQTPPTSDGDTSPKSATDPIRDHWKPDNYATYCIKCFDTFGTFFTPQRKRRHHCRFCGFIFCYNCLYAPQDDTRVLLDGKARFVIQVGPDTSSFPFKACKVCRDCGQNYAKLVAAAVAAPVKDNLSHIFVENPYTATPQPSPIPMPQPASETLAQKPAHDEKSTAVPTDWTWSSF